MLARARGESTEVRHRGTFARRPREQAHRRAVEAPRPTVQRGCAMPRRSRDASGSALLQVE